jgi:hypothetical protein
MEPGSAFLSTEAVLAEAERLGAEGRYGEAEPFYRRLVAQTHVIDYEYEEWLRRLATLYQNLSRSREAFYIYLYLHYFDLARKALPKDEALLRARCAVLEPDWKEAASLFARAGRRIQAAVAYENAKELGAAAELWAAVLKEARVGHAPYERALLSFNAGLASQRALGKDSAEAQRYLIAAQHLLEQVADDFETRGERERAFDCYQILVKLGKDSSQFENLAEGYLNCIRVLKEDGLKFYVLQYYEDFIELAARREELHAAATLYREAADFSLSVGLPYHRHFLRRAAETWCRLAETGAEKGAPAELAENAYGASVEAWAAIGEFAQVRESYRRLATLEVGDKKRARYAALAARYAEAPTDRSEAPEFPASLKQPHAYADVWFLDLVEWEQGGDPEEVAATMVGDLRYPDGFRRRALNLILELLDARRNGTESSPETLSRVAELLGQLQSYAALRPLERLFDTPHAAVRRAVIRALRFLYFKRTFVLVGRALGDAEEPVREAGLEAMRSLHFPHAFQPLSRLYRDHPDERVKIAALETLGKLGSIEATELLVSVVRHESGALRAFARKALASQGGDGVTSLVKQYLEVEENAEVRKIFQELLSRPGR